MNNDSDHFSERERAEAAALYSEITRFFEDFRASTPLGRKLLLPKLRDLEPRFAMLVYDSYARERFGKLTTACKEACRRGAAAEQQDAQIVFGLGDVNQIGRRLRHIGLLD